MADYRAQCLDNGCTWSPHPKSFAETVELIRKHRAGEDHAIRMGPVVDTDE